MRFFRSVDHWLVMIQIHVGLTVASSVYRAAPFTAGRLD